MLMESFEKELVRKFTRREDPEGRARVAAEIRMARGEFFAEQKDLRDKVLSLEESIAQKDKTLESLTKELQETKAKLLSLEEQFLSWILKRSDKRRLGERLVSLEKAQERFEQERSDLAMALEVMKQQRVTSEGLEVARAKLQSFHEESIERINAFLEQEKRDRSIKNVIEEHNVFLVHTIQDGGVPGENSLLQPGTHWRDKFKMVFAFEPTLSSSTIRPGIDSIRQLFASTMGVLLAGGHVDFASFQDAGTRAGGFKTRHLNRDYVQNLLTPGKEEIASAIHGGSAQRGYNEFVVSNPKPVALFMAVERSGDFIFPVSDRGGAPIDDFTAFAKGIQVPWYAFLDGHMYEAEQVVSEFAGPFGPQKVKHLKLGREITTKELTVREGPLDEAWRSQWVEDILIDPPFQERHMPEASLFYSRAYGQARYLDFAALEGRLPDEAIEIPSVGCSYRYKKINGGAEVTYAIHRPQKNQQASYSYTIKPTIFNSASESLGPGFGSAPEKLVTIAAYLRESERIRDEYSGKEDSFGIYREALNRLAYQTYGFAEQATAMGDETTAKSALEIASSIVARDQYQGARERRLDARNRYRLHQEDLVAMQ